MRCISRLVVRSSRRAVAVPLLLGCGLALGADDSIAAPMTTLRVSVPAAGGPANGNSRDGVISNDGTKVAFDSTATNLVPADTNNAPDVFVRDVVKGTTQRVSVSSSEHQAAGTSHVVAISRDGRFILFDSIAPNIVTGDVNGQSDVFVRDLLTRTTRQVDLGQGDVRPHPSQCCPSFGLDISANGRWVLFGTGAPNIVGSNAGIGIVLRDLKKHVTKTIATADNFVAPIAARVSIDGKVIAYSIGGLSTGGDFPGDSFVLTRGAGHKRTRINARPGDGSIVADIARRGRLVLITVFREGTSGAEVFVDDRQTHTRTRVDVSPARAWSISPTAQAVSADGRFVTFVSGYEQFVPGDTNDRFDVFRRDLMLGRTRRISVRAAGGQIDRNSHGGAMAADGRSVAFWTFGDATPGGGNSAVDVFLRGRR